MDLFEHMRSDNALPPAEQIRRRCVFYGRVQGVGFRYQASLLAGRLELTGWVRNRADGAVEAELQGERRWIDRFVKEIQSARWIRVTRLQSEDLPVQTGETRFRVVY